MHIYETFDARAHARKLFSVGYSALDVFIMLRERIAEVLGRDLRIVDDAVRVSEYASDAMVGIDRRANR